jgi:cytochrome c-type biogenesis protein CcmE
MCGIALVLVQAEALNRDSLRLATLTRRPFMSRRAAKYLAAGTILVAAVAYLAYASMKDGWASYHLPVDQFVDDTRFHNQRVRLAGKVAEEGLVAEPGRAVAKFSLLGESKRLPVVYKGVLPDMFKAGGEVVVEGRLDSDGVFRAETLLTKCASKYESGEHGKKQQEKTS